MTATTLQTIESQLKTENEKLASLSVELKETAAWMMSVSGTSEFSERQDVYYPILSKYRAQDKKVKALYAQAADLRKKLGDNAPKSAAAIAMEEKRAIKEANVTSTTYERAQKRLHKEVDGFVCGRY